MLTIIEKVISLQSVDVFSEVSTQQLSHLAAIAREVSFPKGETIYQEQDRADAMYLVLEGQVRVHRDGREVVVAGPTDVFGTWALFDDQPHVAAATTLEDTRLLRIDREDFIDLLSDQVQVTEGVIKALVKRLRGLISRITVEPGSGSGI